MISNMMPRDRYNAKRKAAYERRKAKHLPQLRALAKTMTYEQLVQATGTTRAFVERVVKEEGLRADPLDERGDVTPLLGDEK